MHNAATKAENNLFIFIGLKLSDMNLGSRHPDLIGDLYACGGPRSVCTECA
jgi:hypothetical protein